MTINSINAALETRGYDFRLERKLVDKPNDHYDGVLLRPAGDAFRAVCPTLRIDVLEQFDDINDCIEFLNRQMENIPPFALDFIDCPVDELYRRIRPRIFPTERISEYTDCGIYAEEYNGFGLSYFIDLGEVAGGNSTISLPDNFIEMRDLDVNRLRTEAFGNLSDMFKLVNMNAMLAGLLGEDIPKDVVPDPNPMYVLTTTDSFEGAATIFCPAATKAAEKVFGKRFFILPSSRHEVICVGADSGTPADLTKMVCEVNETQVEEEDILAWNALQYDNGAITVVA